MLRKAADRLLRGLRAYRANRHEGETPADPNDPIQLQRGMALLSFVVVPVLLVMAVLNVLEVPVVIDVLTVALALLVVATCWWVFDVPTPDRSRAGAMTVLIGAIVLLAAMTSAELPGSTSTPFWMGLVILAAATILGVRAAVLVTAFAIATVAAVYLVAAIVAPFAPPLIEALAAARRMFFLAAILAMGIVARRLTDRQLVAVHTQRETIEHQAAALTTEVAERRRAQEELAHSLGEVISEATDGVINYQPDGRIIDANQSAADMLGRDLGALRGRRLPELLSPSWAESTEAPDDLLARLTRPGARVELHVGSDPRAARRTEWAVSARQSTERTVFMAIVRDVTERKRFEARLYRQANYDALTGLPKRHFLAQTLDNLLAVEGADPDLMAVLALRVDDFRTVRDGLGFEFSQEILRVTAKRLNRLLGPGDLAAFSDIAFLILIRESSGRDQTQDLVKRLQTVIAEPIGFAGKQVTVTACVGISTAVRGQHADESLRDAGAALNRARQRGPGQIQFYDDEFRATALQQLDIDNALRTALRRDEFRLVYQPIVSAATGQVLGAEALLRWQREGVGLVPPAAFLQRLEATGLINDVGNWVIRDACRQLAEWQQRIRGADAHRQLPFMHINVSPLQFAGAELRSTVVRSIRTNELEPSDVVLEITESAAFDPRFGITETLRGMREFGIRVAIDDFGTGFSSLSQLRHIHADVLKLDKTFIDHLAHSQRDRAIVAAIITVAQELGLVPVAEGVETPEQHAWLRRMGCQQAQGYLFARPAAPDVSLTIPSAREPEPTPDFLPATAATPSDTEVSP